ncbi:MAG TPA: proliferating cell nuclear antigen (pcna) [Methanobacteriales archaeon]|jgi:monomeric archaeal DNA polymerase sliding clamp|nr:MAG: DNA polymerase sliding clamp [Methanobacteriaceae archaeon 41_258]MBC7088877.1 proliferating cell nuclear antigen (pcna) [Methanobacteriaceae archaeon]HIH61132.1 proliferating cell nuclear antigen (pcna) [Methanobacteriales archaeon]
MFKAELNDPNILRTSFDAISSIVDEVQIQIDSEGMRLDALDRSHITFVHLELKREIFDEYECDEPEKINVDTEELMKVLRRARAGDRLIITSDDANLILTFEGEATRQFKIRLIDIEYETPQPPEIRYENEFEVPFSLLKDAIADIDIFSDKITFQVDEEKFIISSKGEFGDAMIEYYHGEKIKEPARSVYSLDKIREMLKADRFSETATINLGNDMPLKLTLKMPEDEGELSFLLAPRLEAEE